MKISDLVGYNLTQENKESQNTNIFFRQNKVSIFANLKLSLVDFSLANMIRFLLIYTMFKLLMLKVPKAAYAQMQEAQQLQNMQKLLTIAIQNNIHLYIVFSLLFGFIAGSFYHIIMISKLERGTFGMRFAKLQAITKHGKRPSILRATFWYFLKIISPFFLMVAGIVFLTKGLNVAVIVCGIIAIICGPSLAQVLHFQPLYERLSGMKLFPKSS